MVYIDDFSQSPAPKTTITRPTPTPQTSWPMLRWFLIGTACAILIWAGVMSIGLSIIHQRFS